MLNYVTAYQMLHRSAKAKPGQRALIHGAAGGVGSALLQLGRLAQLEMYGTCSSRGASTVSDLGGIPIDYQHLDFVEEIHRLTSEGVNVVFDGIGGTHIWRSRKALRSGGKVVAYGLWVHPGGTIGLRSWRSSSSLSRNRYLCGLHRCRLASPGPEAGGSLQYPVAEAAPTVVVSAGSDRAI